MQVFETDEFGIDEAKRADLEAARLGHKVVLRMDKNVMGRPVRMDQARVHRQFSCTKWGLPVCATPIAELLTRTNFEAFQRDLVRKEHAVEFVIKVDPCFELAHTHKHS